MKAKKLLSILLCLVMMCSLLPMTVLAEGECSNHIIQPVAEQESTCAIAGWRSYYKCDTCGICYSDSEGNNAIDNIDDWKLGLGMIPASHIYSKIENNADGHWFVCTRTDCDNPETAISPSDYHYDDNSNNTCDACGYVMVSTAVTAVTITPTSASVEQGKTQQFKADVSGTGSFDNTVTWSVTGGTASAIDANGLLIVSATESADTLTVTATSVGDTTKFASATVTVTAPAPEHTHSVTTIPGQAPTCKNDGWMDHYQCSCGIFSDEACTDPIADPDAWKQGDGCIPSPGHPLTTNFDETHHWSECAAENCDDPDTAKGTPEAHYDANPKDYRCDFCDYDMRTKLTSVAITMSGMQANVILGSIQFTLPAGCISTESRFATDLDPETYNGTLLPLSTRVEYGKEYWVVIQLTTDEGYAFPDPEPGCFTLNGEAAIAVMNLSAELADDSASGNSDEYAVLFKLPVLTAPPSGHGHSHVQGDYKSDDTYHWQQCASTNCNDLAGSIINKAKHKGGTATCLAKAECSVCGEEYGKKLDHDYSEWVVVKEPTDTAYGKKERTCSMCKGVHMEYIPPLGQNPQTGDTNDVFGWSSLLAAAVAGFLGVVFQSRKKKED